MDKGIESLIAAIDEIAVEKNVITGIKIPLQLMDIETKKYIFKPKHINDIVEMLNDNVVRRNIVNTVNIEDNDLDIIQSDDIVELVIYSYDNVSTLDVLNLLNIIDIELQIYSIFSNCNCEISIDKNKVNLVQY